MDVSWQQLLVVGAALVFAGFLLWKYKPTSLLRVSHGSRGRHKGGDAASLAAAIKAARQRARGATNARARSEALTEAAKAAALLPDATTSAMGFYLRAMRADATFCDPVRGVAELLRYERPRLLETVLWRRLSHLAWSGDTVDAVRCAAEELGSLYKRELRNRDKAKVMQRLVARLSP